MKHTFTVLFSFELSSTFYPCHHPRLVYCCKKKKNSGNDELAVVGCNSFKPFFSHAQKRTPVQMFHCRAFFTIFFHKQITQGCCCCFWSTFAWRTIPREDSRGNKNVINLSGSVRRRMIQNASRQRGVNKNHRKGAMTIHMGPKKAPEMCQFYSFLYNPPDQILSSIHK